MTYKTEIYDDDGKLIAVSTSRDFKKIKKNVVKSLEKAYQKQENKTMAVLDTAVVTKISESLVWYYIKD